MRRLFKAAFLISLFYFKAANGQAVKTSGNKRIAFSRKNISRLPASSDKVDSLLYVSSYYLNKPGSETADMRSANSFAGQALQLSWKLHSAKGEAESYTVLSQISRESGKESAGKGYIEKSLKIFDKNPFPAAASKAYFEAASYYSIYADTSLSRKIEFYSKGLKQLENSSPQPAELAGALKMMGDLYQFRSDYAQSLPYLKRSLKLYQQAGVKTLQDIYALLGMYLWNFRIPRKGSRIS
jgi:tetratricopeptide (TPR) repeat protein